MRPGWQTSEHVLTFWFHETKPYQWYRSDAAFDQTVQRRFGNLYSLAKSQQLNAWRSTPRGALALIILLDQFSRNLHRDTPQAFAQDKAGLAIARNAILRRFTKLFPKKEQAFFYMPFMHSENLADQDMCVRLFKANLPDTNNLLHALQHRNIIARFGRFPHRNNILGRQSTPEEMAFLSAGGFNP